MLGPLATYAEPHCYDLCSEHSERLTAPRGWEVVRLAIETGRSPANSDDLEALADAVREAARPRPGATASGGDPGTSGRPGTSGHREPAGEGTREVARRGHLRVLRSPEP